MSGYMPTLLGSRLCLSGAAPAYPYIWRSSSRSAILVVWVVVGMWIKAVLAPVLREDSSFVGPCEETRAGTERQAHPSADEVVHGRLYRGAIKRSSLKAPDQQPRRPADLQALPVTDNADRGLVDNRYTAVNTYPSEHRRFAVVSLRAAAKFALLPSERRYLL